MFGEGERTQVMKAKMGMFQWIVMPGGMYGYESLPLNEFEKERRNTEKEVLEDSHWCSVF